MSGVNETLSGAPSGLRRVLADVVVERRGQDGEFGEQNHPHADPVILGRLNNGGKYGTPERVASRLAEHYEIPAAARARFFCQAEARDGGPTWMGIAVEELAEVLEATTADPARLRAEWVQLAAVAVVAVECIDRKAAAEARGADL